jgi:hypothetical protein
MHWLLGRRSSKSSSAFNPRLSDPFWTHLGT